MKTNSIFRLALPFLSATLLLSACNKTEEPAAPAVTQTTPPAPAPAPAPVPEPPKPEEVKAAVDSAVAQPPKPAETVVVAPAAPTVPDASSQTQTLLERIKALIADKKYPEALSALSEISTASLTADQQKLVEQLKGQAQNAVAKQSADQGLKAVGGLLDRKK